MDPIFGSFDSLRQCFFKATELIFGHNIHRIKVLQCFKRFGREKTPSFAKGLLITQGFTGGVGF